jgi:opacity protein-like surface antigen
LAYRARVTHPFAPRPPRRLAAALALGALVAGAAPAVAQGASPVMGFGALPVFAWPQRAEGEEGRWSGSRARISTGFEAVSSRRFGSYAGPTVGLEGQRMWQDGRLVYGVVGRVDYLAAIGGGPNPGFGGVAYSRDFSGAAQLQVGALLTPDVLLYAKAGVMAVHEKTSFGATPVSTPFSRETLAVRPEARVGIEWAVTDRISIGLEAGVVGRAVR